MRQHELRKFRSWICTGFLLFLAVFQGKAAAPVSSPFEQANRLYEQGNYNEAVTLYQNIIKSGRRSPALHFNLGNAYFKSGQPGRALFHYRMAESLAPRDPDIQANLRFARERVPDTVSISAPYRERFFRYFTLNELAKVAALLFWIWAGLVAIGQVRPATAPRLRGMGLLVGSVLAATLLLLIFALLTSRSQFVIVVSPGMTTIHLGPLAESQPSFTAEDGAELELLARREEWLQVRDRMNRSGWIQQTNVLVFPPAR